MRSALPAGNALLIISHAVRGPLSRVKGAKAESGLLLANQEGEEHEDHKGVGG